MPRQATNYYQLAKPKMRTKKIKKLDGATVSKTLENPGQLMFKIFTKPEARPQKTENSPVQEESKVEQEQKA